MSGINPNMTDEQIQRDQELIEVVLARMDNGGVISQLDVQSIESACIDISEEGLMNAAIALHKLSPQLHKSASDSKCRIFKTEDVFGYRMKYFLKEKGIFDRISGLCNQMMMTNHKRLEGSLSFRISLDENGKVTCTLHENNLQTDAPKKYLAYSINEIISLFKGKKIDLDGFKQKKRDVILKITYKGINECSAWDIDVHEIKKP